MTTPRRPSFVGASDPDANAARRAAVDDLQSTPARIAFRFFYDRLGSTLFEAITALDAYYPTRTEAEVFRRHGQAIATAAGAGRTLVDLGAGNCAKAAGLFALLEPRRYVAVDVSVDFLRDALRQLQREHPLLEIVGIGQDFSASLDIPADLTVDSAPLFFYPGSSIGNFTPESARAFLRRVHDRAAATAAPRGDGAGILVGVDLVKDRAVLERAYDDELGVTAAFNRNALLHLNRAIGADFDPRDWRHVAFFDERLSRIEMHLEARRAVSVSWPGGGRDFAAAERIHTENSYKYTVDGFARLLHEAGFSAARHWTDPAGWFAVFHARA